MRLPPHPAEIYGALFHAVQRAGVFGDQKTFVDCVPRLPPEEIVRRHGEAQRREGFDLRSFVAEHFLVPETHLLVAQPAETVGHHLERSWTLLRREPDAVVEGSSLLPLAHPYIIPGGRFREIYYWDTFFTMLGLRASGREDLIIAMTDNLADLIRRYGMIPNGNRSYYLTRSHPPVLALIVELLAEREGAAPYGRYRPALQAEWDYWQDAATPAGHRCVLADGSELQRYYDSTDEPRWEAFAHDEELAQAAGAAPGLFRHLRSAAESGWDFSSRWFAGGATLAHTRTAEFAPVDLNCFLVQLERTLARSWRVAGDMKRSRQFAEAAQRRIAAIRRHCWSESAGFFFDLHLPGGILSPHRTLAAVVPLYLQVATPAQAAAVAGMLRKDFLHPGGLATTLTRSGEQWDFPNGWAPLQWMAIRGLVNYGHHELAAEIATRWVRLNSRMFTRTGLMLEKYNVVEPDAPPQGGEYLNQDGFGWTNGVLLNLLKAYPLSREKQETAPPDGLAVVHALARK